MRNKSKGITRRQIISGAGAITATLGVVSLSARGESSTHQNGAYVKNKEQPMMLKQSNAFQSAWVVDDVESAALHWAETTGVGPFFVAEYKEGALKETMYRGRPSPITMKTALAQAGDIQIELIQPTGNHRSAYRDTVPVGKSAFHHMAFWSNDLEADVARYIDKGFEVAARGGPGFVYIDTSAVLGYMVELVEDSEMIRAMFKMIADSSENWDGSNPVRSFGFG